MKINKKKSGIIYLRYNRRSEGRIDVNQTFQGYPVVSKYKYLGVVFDEAL